ncbi:MAG: nonstructural protein [Microvirus sp.]|nr:MAG: nonstructural protein [Microvirus sp.]
MNLYSLRDVKLGTYAPPMCYHNDGVAVRELGDYLEAQDSPFRKHPYDYDLYQVGEWNEQTAQLKQLDTPRHVVCVATITEGWATK